MGKKLSHKIAFEQYNLIKKLRNKKGIKFECDVRFEIPTMEAINMESIDISLSEYPYAETAYFNIGIHWEDSKDQLSKEEVKLLESVYSKSASTNYQTVKQVDLFEIALKNDNVTIYLIL